jgi:hypothetical protein
MSLITTLTDSVMGTSHSILEITSNLCVLLGKIRRSLPFIGALNVRGGSGRMSCGDKIFGSFQFTGHCRGSHNDLAKSYVERDISVFVIYEDLRSRSIW